MHAEQLLHNQIQKECPTIHKYRLTSLFLGVQALLTGHRLSITQLGRDLKYPTKARSRVKLFDRLVSNSYLHSELPSIYSVIANLVITSDKQPWIHIDWSCLSSLSNLYLLRASVSVKGRSITVYEEVHPKKNDNHHPTHVKFLNNLKQILPKACKPIIVTDAGFRGIWFKAILSLKWDFVGRLRNINAVKLGNNAWTLSKKLYELATNKPECLGKGLLTQTNEVPATFITYKKLAKKRVFLTRRKLKSISGSSKKYAKTNKDPWLLVTSLAVTALEVVRIYKQRMQIEENFRDTKSWRFGFGLEHSQTRSDKRMAVLVMISTLATLICWIAGFAAIRKGIDKDYQVQSSRVKNAISIVFLGKEVLKQEFKICKRTFTQAFAYIQNIIVAERIAPL